jgi:hypothetical protein
MKSGAARRAIGLVFLYIGIFCLLVLLQFSRREGFSERMGGLTVSATYPKSGRDTPQSSPSRVTIAFAPVSIEISQGSPAELVSSDGKVKTLRPRSVERRLDGIHVLLEGNAELTVKAEGKSSESELFRLSASLPEGTARLRLRYSLGGRTKIVAEGPKPIIEGGRSTFELSMSRSSLVTDKRFFLIGPRNGSVSIAAIHPAPTKPGQKPAAALAQAPEDSAAYKAAIAAWRNLAWTGLAAKRFDGERLAWRQADGSLVFSEKALSAYLAEALARGVYAEAIAKMRPARELHPDRLSYLSAPFLGGMARAMEDLERSDALEAKRIALLIQDRSPAVFEKEGLAQFLYDRSDLVPELPKFALSIDPDRLDLPQSVGLLACLVETSDHVRDEENPFRAFESAADRIHGALRRVEEGLFLADETGEVDLRLSLLAGQSLIAFGRSEEKDAITGLGQALVRSALALADESGFLPARLDLGSEGIESRSGALAPEEIYSVVASNPFYPHAVSFYRNAAPRTWAWTCASSLTLEASASTYVFSASFAEGRSHYLAFFGVKPFSNIQLYDIDYRPDIEFEVYDAPGYYYKKDQGAMYVKMKHKAVLETVKLSF